MVRQQVQLLDDEVQPAAEGEAGAHGTGSCEDDAEVSGATT
jgi:hypothetical protein